MYQRVGPEFHRFMTEIFKEVGHKIPYIAVLEAQGTGNPHIHILFLGVARVMDWRLIRKYWGLGCTWINRTENDKKIKNPLAYMFKYITKTFKKTDNKNLKT